jgi:hypothetical protein
MKIRSYNLQILALALLLVYVLSVFRIIHPYLSYNLNYEYISNVLCENKAKPEMNCHGKCHLQKELKKTANEEGQKKALSAKIQEIEAVADNDPDLLFNQKFSFKKKKYPSFKEVLHSISAEKLAPPPQA